MYLGPAGQGLILYTASVDSHAQQNILFYFFTVNYSDSHRKVTIKSEETPRFLLFFYAVFLLSFSHIEDDLLLQFTPECGYFIIISNNKRVAPKAQNQNIYILPTGRVLSRPPTLCGSNILPVIPPPVYNLNQDICQSSKLNASFLLQIYCLKVK